MNTAARLESFDKDGFGRDPLRRSCRILISDTTMGYVAGQVDSEAVGEHELPGRAARVGIFRISRPSTDFLRASRVSPYGG